MRNVSYAEALRALNNLAYDAAKSCPTEDGKRQLRQICFQLDALVEALPSRLSDFRGEVPALQSALVEGARLP